MFRRFFLVSWNGHLLSHSCIDAYEPTKSIDKKLKAIHTSNHTDTAKHVLKGPLKIYKTKVLMGNGSLMKVESIAECSLLEPSAILLTCIKQ